MYIYNHIFAIYLSNNITISQLILTSPPSRQSSLSASRGSRDGVASDAVASSLARNPWRWRQETTPCTRAMGVWLWLPRILPLPSGNLT